MVRHNVGKMERWNVQHRVTCVHSYYTTKSVTKVQHVFRRQFAVGRHDRVLSRNIILAWVKKYGETGSEFDVKHGAPRTVRTPEILQRVREAFERSP
jgi:transposase